jgi:hypothetical protein
VAGFLEECVDDFPTELSHVPKVCCRRITIAVLARILGRRGFSHQALQVWFLNAISTYKTHTESSKQFANPIS